MTTRGDDHPPWTWISAGVSPRVQQGAGHRMPQVFGDPEWADPGRRQGAMPALVDPGVARRSLAVGIKTEHEALGRQARHALARASRGCCGSPHRHPRPRRRGCPRRRAEERHDPRPLSSVLSQSHRSRPCTARRRWTVPAPRSKSRAWTATISPCRPPVWHQKRSSMLKGGPYRAAARAQDRAEFAGS